jgi:Flp pilus assembly pilin Flp
MSALRRTQPRDEHGSNVASMAWIAALVALVVVAGAALYNWGRDISTSAVVPDATTGQSPSPKAPSTNQ